MTPVPTTGAAEPATTERAAAAATKAPRAWILPFLFAVFCVVTLWCAVALLAERHGAPSSPARRVAPVAALRVG